MAQYCTEQSAYHVGAGAVEHPCKRWVWGLAPHRSAHNGKITSTIVTRAPLGWQDIDEAQAGYRLLPSSEEIRRHRSRSLDERIF